MKMRLSKRDKNIIDNLDRLIAGQEAYHPSSYLEEKLLQTLKSFEYSKETKVKEQQSVAKLISDISHQLKTPLSALSVHLELALDESFDKEERTLALHECREQVDKIHYLSEAMFKVVRLENGLISVKKTRNDIIVTLTDAILAIKPTAEAKGLLIESYLPDILFIPHDPFWTKEALVNIIDNAIKYTDKGIIKIILEQGAIYTRIDICDTGIGLKQEDYSKIFTRFYRVRLTGTERIEGTGLGLPIAREILRQQQGNIIVSSILGKGSTFSVFLQNC